MKVSIEKHKSDNEYYREMTDVHKSLVSVGWEKGEAKILDNLIFVYYHKNGLTIHITYGCSERVKEEML